MLQVNNVLDSSNFKKLSVLNNRKALEIVEYYIDLCKPRKVTVITDNDEDINYIRDLSVKLGEESLLAAEGHTIHYDGYQDQARDKKNTRVLLPKGKKLSKHINSIDRDEGLAEIHEILDGIMEGKEMFVRFFCLGPTDSKFSIRALQITDSAYVSHSEDLLYRKGYQEFMRFGDSEDFFHLIHSAGELIGAVTKNIEKRRIYIDLEENRVLTVNNQYAGNSLGLKKLCLRLAINKAISEDWLTEHMFISGIYSLNKSRKTYFLGAFPSACGKTSTAMIPGHTIVGDDIAYLRIDEKGIPYAANIEAGVFGIIKDVNPVDDPLIYNVITSPREMIFSNVLQKDGKVYWEGMDANDPPTSGINHSGEWFKGKIDGNENTIPISHPNSRYTIRIGDLDNCDENLHNPDGVPFRGIIYGGRDSDTAVPISQSFDWDHGVILGSSIESETTAATLGKVGIRVNQPMANLDFVVVPLSTYVEAHFSFGKRLDSEDRVKVFSTNYFLKDENGKFIDDKVDKKAWLVWAEGRIHGDFDSIETPIGFIPKFDDLVILFKEIFGKEYTKLKYETEFSIRVSKYLDKLNRVEKFFNNSEVMPEKFVEQINLQRNRLIEVKNKYGSDVISPDKFIQ
ncbi:MAG: Phosphoenolpyruvate carboxykinase [GTP] [Candidatus Heimdallarchaeota archaeon LC_2]|nr:MAG: Phosphoenolpyruvate carboxykinase [GTP] [Candidatus Heimdallarchaeota archaeon LC_2]